MKREAGLRIRLFARSFLLQAGFSDERCQALGFAWAIDPALTRLLARDAQALATARARHLLPFNSQPHAVGLPLGIAAALEGRAASGDAAAAARVVPLKAALGAALAGSADPFFWGALRPLSGALAVTTALAVWRFGVDWPFVWGAGLGLLVFNLPALAARWIGISRGLSDGEAAAAAAAFLPVRAWILVSRRAAVALIFTAVWIALEASFVSSRMTAAAAFASGAALSRVAGGPLRLIAAAGALGAAAAAAGWTS